MHVSSVRIGRYTSRLLAAWMCIYTGLFLVFPSLILLLQSNDFFWWKQFFLGTVLALNAGYFFAFGRYAISPFKKVSFSKDSRVAFFVETFSFLFTFISFFFPTVVWIMTPVIDSWLPASWIYWLISTPVFFSIVSYRYLNGYARTTRKWIIGITYALPILFIIAQSVWT